MSKIALALVLTLISYTQVLSTELWVIKDNDCVPCRRFHATVYPVYLRAEAQNSRLPPLRIKDTDRDRREVMDPRIHRYWRGTPSFILVEEDGRARAIYPDFSDPMGFIEDVMQAVE